MSILKSISSSIGSAAGVAWPMFGIVSASLSLAGPTAVALGSGCGILFILVSIPVFYILYCNAIEEQNKIDKKLNLCLSDFLENSYITYCFKDKTNQKTTLGEYLNALLLTEDGSKQNAIQIKFIEFITQNHPRFLSEYGRYGLKQKKDKLRLIINDFLRHTNLGNAIESLDFREGLKVAFISFVSAFSAISGFSAGLMGVLVKVGLLAGFGAIPFLGWAALITALIVGICAAVVSVHIAITKDKKVKLYKDFKNFNCDFVAEFDPESCKTEQRESNNNVSLSSFNRYRTNLTRRVVNPARGSLAFLPAKADMVKQTKPESASRATLTPEPN